MTTVEHREAALAARPRAGVRRRPPRPLFRGMWWRHVVGLIAIAFALFPIAYVVSAAFNADQSIGGTSLIPREMTSARSSPAR